MNELNFSRGKKEFFAPLLALVDTLFQSERLSHEKGDTNEGKKCNSRKGSF